MRCEHPRLEIRWFFSDAEKGTFCYEYEFCPDCDGLFYPIESAQHLQDHYRYEDIRDTLKCESFQDISDSRVI